MNIGGLWSLNVLNALSKKKDVPVFMFADFPWVVKGRHLWPHLFSISSKRGEVHGAKGDFADPATLANNRV